MAVTINEMDVDVRDRATPAQAPAATGAPKEPLNFRSEKETLAERELRLKAD